MEVTNACNVKCSSCMSPHGNQFMSVKDFKTILSKIPDSEKKPRVALHWRGEPCLHPKLPEIVEAGRDMGVKAWISTNTVAPPLSNKNYVERLLSGLSRIEVCVDGYNQETLSKYRVGSNWNSLLRNVENIGSADTSCLLDMRVLMFKYNENHEGFFMDLARKNGFNRICFAKPIINYKTRLNASEVREYLATKKKYQRYRRDGKHWVLKRSKKCIPHVCVSVHGTTHPCGLDWKLEYALGNLLIDDWISTGEELARLRPIMLRKALSICERWCCLSDEKVNTWMKL